MTIYKRADEVRVRKDWTQSLDGTWLLVQKRTTVENKEGKELVELHLGDCIRYFEPSEAIPVR